MQAWPWQHLLHTEQPVLEPCSPSKEAHYNFISLAWSTACQALQAGQNQPWSVGAVPEQPVCWARLAPPSWRAAQRIPALCSRSSGACCRAM